MRVLVVDEAPAWPTNSGKNLRTFHLLREAARRHDITCVLYADSERDADSLAAYREAGLAVIPVPPPRVPKAGLPMLAALAGSALSRQPFSVWAYDRREYRRAVAAAVAGGGFDLFHCELGQLAEMIELAGDLPTALDAHNVETRIWRRLADAARDPLHSLGYRWQAGRMERFEKRYIPRYDLVLAVSELDAAELNDSYGARRCVVVDNGVDTGAVRPRGPRPAGGDVVIQGSLDWRPMQDGVVHFLEAVLPLLRERRPDIGVTVAGRRPPDWLRRRCAAEPGVRLLADVPDMRAVLEEAAAVAVPLRVGSGSRLKILEALAMERPVVSTTVGAEGLAVRHGEHLLLADDPQRFAEALDGLLEGGPEVEAMVARGRRFVETRHDWRLLADRMVSAWEETVSLVRSKAS